MINALPSKAKIKKTLISCCPHAAPGTHGLKVYFYQKCWPDIIGDSLTEVICAVFQGSKPSACQRTSLMVFGKKPGNKAKSLLMSDCRKISFINVNFKLMTGIEAARIITVMNRMISPIQLVTGGNKRISQGVAMANDAICAAGRSKTKFWTIDTDLVAAFCNMVSTWCLKVMAKKSPLDVTLDRYRNLYNDNYSIVVVFCRRLSPSIRRMKEF